MNYTRHDSYRLLLASILCAGSPVLGQQPATPTKVPRELPHQLDVKSPAPARRGEAVLADGQAIATATSVDPVAPAGRIAGTGLLAGLGRSAVLFDEPGDGRLWAVGDGYKASFGPEGATYIPFFGSRAPRNFPVRFRLVSIASGGEAIAFAAEVEPVRAGSRVAFDRGAVSEVYDLTPAGMEQSFVFGAQLAPRDLVIEVAVESDLDRATDGADLVLSGAPGSVRYTQAFAVDARAGRTAVPTGWAGDSIRIAVPAERVARASWPLVVDPIVSNFGVDSSPTLDHGSPDVAWDETNATWMVVYERAFSATDHDVYYSLLDATGFNLLDGILDATSGYWGQAKVANNNLANQFLFVAAVGDPAGGARTIRGRTRYASLTGATGAAVTISADPTHDCHAPDVGGDPLLAGPTYYCVVWQRDFSATDSDVHARLVRADSSLVGTGTVLIDNSGSTLDQSPTISKGDGDGGFSTQDWTVVWTREVGTLDHDLHGARIHWDGVITDPSFAIDTGSSNTISPSVSSPTLATPRRVLVAYTVANIFSGSHQTWGKLLEGATVLDTADLTALSFAPGGEDQTEPSVDCDGYQFVLANSETVPGSSTDTNILFSTFATLGNDLVLAEGHLTFVPTAVREDQVEVACTGSAGGLTRRTLAVWHEQTGATNGDIQGSLYDADLFTSFCNPGAGGVIACPCGNAPSGLNRGCDNAAGTGGATLNATGSTAPDTVVLGATGLMPSTLCLFAQGDAFSAAGGAFGDGVRCVNGQVLRLATKTAAGGIASFPTGSDPSISARAASLGAPIALGSKRYYFVYYRDPNSFACAATFNSTNAVMAQW